jgi:hypothetical protein
LAKLNIENWEVRKEKDRKGKEGKGREANESSGILTYEIPFSGFEGSVANGAWEYKMTLSGLL